ncbi:hypothetical protein RND71_018065 [Anisodus tanguticus]|uniref:Uncharacterized protein n=1 Tax=Anisodus tanguticus TaxID=243964 RepID=A0AAE1S4P0_9SOLA|nr:hypothetical protein RND71_018065 [Anisodus tanguticus]
MKQAPAAITLSSGSESPLDKHHLSDDEDSVNLSKLFQKDKTSLSEAKSSQDGDESQPTKMSEVNSPIKNEKAARTPTRKRKKENQSEKEGKSTDKEPNPPVCTLSSDSESPHDGSSIKVEEVLDKELLMHDAKATKKEENNVLSKKKSPKKKTKKEEQEKKIKLENQLNEEKEGMDVVEENILEKQSGPNLSSSRLPLVLPEKVQRTKVNEAECSDYLGVEVITMALVECEGDSVDLSGDVGAVGRIIISDGPSGNHEMLLDLKGKLWTIRSKGLFLSCLLINLLFLSMVEAIMNDFIQLKSQSNVSDAETMVEGTLDGSTFDSDEAENLPRPASQGDQNENVDHQNGIVKGKAKKASVCSVLFLYHYQLLHFLDHTLRFKLALQAMEQKKG